MFLEREAGGYEPVDVAGAPLDFEDLVACGAEKVVMVILAGDLVSRGLAGDLNDGDAADFDEGVDGSINGCEPHARDVLLGVFQEFGCAKWPVHALERVENGGSLLRGAHACDDRPSRCLRS